MNREEEAVCRAIFEQYSHYVYVIIWNRIRTVGTHEDAEEAVSDVFADVFRSLGKIEPDKTGNYIRTLAKHKAVDTVRKLSARRESPPDEETLWQEAPAPDDVALDHERAAQRQILLDRIAALGEPDATIILLKYYYDCSAEEIGRRVGLSRIAVRTRLSRARTRLRNLLADDDISL